MLSAVIRARHSYPALPRAGQLVDQRSVLSGPLVLGKTLLKNLRLSQIGDQPVSRMFVICYQMHGLYHLLLYKEVDVLAFLSENSNSIIVDRTKSLRVPAKAGFPRLFP